MKKIKKVKKTSYCIHETNCDREEKCFEGEYCPFFSSQKFTDEPVIDLEEIAKQEFDAIWKGD